MKEQTRIAALENGSGRQNSLSAPLNSRKSRKSAISPALLDGLSEADRNRLGDNSVNVPGMLLRRIAEVEKENRRLKSLLLTDDLTGLYNRRFFLTQLEIEISRAKRTGQSCCLMMIDCDNFKLINDTVGHDGGDRFLKKIGRLIRDNLRSTDFVCRYGGDEFAVIMPDTHLPEGVIIAERLLKSISLVRVKKDLRVSASIGIAAYDVFSEKTATDFFKESDLELYRAKERGRNRISHPALAAMARRETTAVGPEEKMALYRIRKKK
ncbi:MAG: GGDEF domain-containing protein [Syntrophales bacterium]